MALTANHGTGLCVERLIAQSFTIPVIAGHLQYCDKYHSLGADISAVDEVVMYLTSMRKLLDISSNYKCRSHRHPRQFIKAVAIQYIPDINQWRVAQTALTAHIQTPHHPHCRCISTIRYPLRLAPLPCYIPMTG